MEADWQYNCQFELLVLCGQSPKPTHQSSVHCHSILLLKQLMPGQQNAVQPSPPISYQEARL